MLAECSKAMAQCGEHNYSIMSERLLVPPMFVPNGNGIMCRLLASALFQFFSILVFADIVVVFVVVEFNFALFDNLAEYVV